MLPIGYLYKRVQPRPDWIVAAGVKNIYSLSECISAPFADYINEWKHNGYWLFDAPEIMQEMAAQASIPLDDCALFYYEAYELQYDPTEGKWAPFDPVADWGVNVKIPAERTLEGFDVVSYWLQTSPECSPLSCNNLAQDIRTNEHCLFDLFEEARSSIEQGMFDDSEPGPYRIVAVYSVPGI